MTLIDITKRPTASFAPDTVFLALPKEKDLKVGKSYAIQSGVQGPIIYKEVEYPLTAGATRVDVKSSELTLTKLEPGDKFPVASSEQNWIVGSRRFLINVSGSDLVVPYVCVGVGAVVPDQIEEGRCWITNGFAVAEPPWTIITKINGIDQRIPLQKGGKFLKTNGEWWRFDGLRETPDFEPIYVAWICDKNLDFENITNETFQAALSADDDGNQPQIGTPIWVTTALLLAQDDKRQNGLYIIGPNSNPKIIRLSPFESGNVILEDYSIIQVRRGKYKGQMYAPAIDGAQTGPTSDSRITLDTTPHEWIQISASALQTKQQAAQIATLESEVKSLSAQLAKGSVSEESDPVALKALATAKDEFTQAIAAKADSDTVSTEIESLSDEIEALDLSKADKSAVEASNKAIADLTALLKSNDATDADIQKAVNKANEAIAAAKKSIDSLGAGKRTVRTTATTLNAAIGDNVHIDGEGDIQLPLAPTDGAELQVFDFFAKIKAGKNNVLLGSGDRWLMSDGTFDATATEFEDNPFRRGLMTLQYSAPSKSWRPYVVYGNELPAIAPAPTGTGLKAAIKTGDVTLTANPFDVIHLEGTGNIQIGSFNDLEYFEVQWSGVHNVTVLRATGFTIDGVDEDFLLDTAGMGVRRLVFKRVGNDFEVS